MVVRTLLRRLPSRMAECSESIPRPCDYTIINGFRFVKPYHFDFACSVKERWAGQTLLEVFSREFPARSRSYYVRAIAEGRLRLETGGAKQSGAPGRPAGLSPDTILRPGQRMRHLIHRHEPPVLGGSVPVLGETEEIVAAGKPAGMPVHVSGQYRKNTVLGVLQAERPELGSLLPVHRLDKPVSGVLLFARSAAAADLLRRRIEAHDVEKVYVARVLGRFPETPDPLVVTVPLAWDQQHNHVLACPDAVVMDEEDAVLKDDEDDGRAGAQQDRTAPHEGIAGGESAASTLPESSSSAKHAFRAQRRERALAKRAKQEAQRAARMKSGSQLHPPKSAKTEFRLLNVAPDGKTSLVECRPRTGRTHQIRVHLQYLGHPIANDGQYGGSYGGPLASRLLAQAFGVAWDQMRKAAGLPVWGEGTATKTTATTTGEEHQHKTHILPHDDGSAEGEVPRTGPRALKRLKAGLNEGGGGADEVMAIREGQVSTLDPQHQSANCRTAVIPNRDASTYAQNQAFRSDDAYVVPEQFLDADCPHCPFLAPVDYPLDLRPLWLHARSYSCSEWAFQAPLPDWAQEDFIAL